MTNSLGFDESIEEEIKERGLTAPRVTLASINAAIDAEHAFTLDQVIPASEKHKLFKHTIVVLVMKNGFIVTGESSCVSAENFDPELGKKIARQNAIDKLWPLEGYALRTRIHEGW